MSLKIKIPSYKIINYYYAIAILAYFSAIYFPFLRVGLLMSLIMCIGIYVLYWICVYSTDTDMDIF